MMKISCGAGIGLGLVIFITGTISSPKFSQAEPSPTQISQTQSNFFSRLNSASLTRPVSEQSPPTQEPSQISPPIPLLAYQQSMADLKASGQRWIEIDVTRQRLLAWEGNRPVYAVIISTGKDSTPTPTGRFAIQTRHRYARMQGDDYDIPDVPYTMYYYGGYAIHGAYWHNSFGTPVSHGCINVAVDHARWLFDWVGIGTPVLVHD
jgi:lipoprotein-anchoring transpeptidase ErfK/SrfK